MAGFFERGRKRRQDRRNVRRGANQPAEAADNAAAIGQARQQAAMGQGNAAQSRGQLGGIFDTLQGAAEGSAPSVAQAQLAAGNQQTVANQLGMLGAARGGSLASQQRSAQGVGAAGAMGLNNQTAQLRAGEMAQARGQLGQFGMGMAGLDQQAMLQQQAMLNQNLQQGAGWVQQANLANRGFDIQQLGNNRQFGMDMTKMGLGALQQGATMGMTAGNVGGFGGGG